MTTIPGNNTLAVFQPGHHLHGGYTRTRHSRAVKVSRSETASQADDIPLLGRPFQVDRRGSGRYGNILLLPPDILLLEVINGKLQFSFLSVCLSLSRSRSFGGELRVATPGIPRHASSRQNRRVDPGNKYAFGSLGDRLVTCR